MKYEKADDIGENTRRIAGMLGMCHIDFSRLTCIRSFGSKSRAIARCYGLPKVMQLALGTKAHYVIEVISERFDRMNEVDKTKTLIHELMHIPKSMGGGFRFHAVVSKSAVDEMYKKLKSAE